MRFSGALLIAAVLFLAGCNTYKRAQLKDEKVASEEELPIVPKDVFSFSGDTTEIVLLDEVEQERAFVVASIERTGCYGKCPSYKAKIFSNGLVLYEGRAHVEKQGIFEAYIIQNQVDSLIAQADSISFFDLPAAYPINGIEIYDLPNTNTFIRSEDYEKTITNNHNAPRILRNYEFFFEELLEQLDWKKVDDVE
ncbi:MAG: DUF6438 domain-containing protein [Bacteroidota bacterium]